MVYSMKAMFVVVEWDAEHNIVFLEDIANQTGGTTITNDAENVVLYCLGIYGRDVKVVYRDTDQEWWMIDWAMHDPSRVDVRFQPWHGRVWYELSKAES